jgi:hypothetical protein
MVLGLTGPNAAGKGEVADYLRARGFTVHSLSDVVREEARLRGLPPEREHLIRVGNLLRKQSGAGVLAERILPRLGARMVVDSVRNPAEVTVLRRLPRFVLLGVDAPVEVRFERSLRRARPGDPGRSRSSGRGSGRRTPAIPRDSSSMRPSGSPIASSRTTDRERISTCGSRPRSASMTESVDCRRSGR